MLTFPTAAILSSSSFFSRDSQPQPPWVSSRPPQAFAASASTAYAASEECAPCSSPYEILGISTGASCREIKAAYRRLARILHPDAAEIDRKYHAAHEFMKIRDAYSTLSDPEKRADYERKTLPRYRSLNSAAISGGFCRYSGRNWETDQCW